MTMPLRKGRVTCEGETFTLTTGAATNRSTTGANPRLDTGGILRMVCVELSNGSAPIHTVIHLFHEGTMIELTAGWVRGPSDHGGAGALIWRGRLDLGTEPKLFVYARNDTGATLDPTLHWLVEKI